MPKLQVKISSFCFLAFLAATGVKTSKQLQCSLNRPVGPARRRRSKDFEQPLVGAGNAGIEVAGRLWRVLKTTETKQHRRRFLLLTNQLQPMASTSLKQLHYHHHHYYSLYLASRLTRKVLCKANGIKKCY